MNLYIFINLTFKSLFNTISKRLSNLFLVGTCFGLHIAFASFLGHVSNIFIGSSTEQLLIHKK